MKLQRTWRGNIYYILWAAFSFTNFVNSISPVKKYVWLGSGILASILLIIILLKSTYMEVVNEELLIRNDFFKTDKVKIANIEKMVSKPSPMKSAYFLLKDNSKVKFNEASVNYTALRELMRQLNITVE
jgi:hypothetical protein